MIGLDAFSSRGLQKAATPAMNEMIAQGALAPYARCILPTVSTPNWTSMLTGVDPVQHGIYDNSWERESRHWDPVLTGQEDVYPSVLSWLKDQRPDAKMHFFYEWDGLSRMFEMSVVDKKFRSEKGHEVFDEAVKSFFAEKPDFLFIGIDETDAAGHRDGHDTQGYYDAISFYDEKIGGFISRLKEEGLMEETAILITGDHGGINFGHGGRTLYELEIPIILYGKGVSPGKVLDHPYYIYDVAPTLAYWLGITPPPATIGRVMEEAFSTQPSQSHYVPIPHIEPKEGFFKEGVNVKLQLDHPVGKLHYTLDGTTPTDQSAVYEHPIRIEKNGTLNTVHIIDGKKSRLESAVYRVPTGPPLVSWNYFEGSYSTVPPLDKLDPVRSGMSHELSLDEIVHREDQFAVSFQATLNLQQDGEYIFYSNSDDGSILFVNGQKVVDNDGSHAMTEKSGKISLLSGKHSLEVWYFDDSDGQKLEVYIQGPDIPKQIITENFLSKP
nr:sulfatase-like hydrolase/transferase [Cytophagales bacterium]